MSSAWVFALVAIIAGVVVPKTAKSLYLNKSVSFGFLRAAFYVFSALFVAGVTLTTYLVLMELFNNRVVAIIIGGLVLIPGITRYLGQNIPHSLTVIKQTD
jgi:ABC-type Co2+ transport system permease subunit